MAEGGRIEPGRHAGTPHTPTTETRHLIEHGGYAGRHEAPPVLAWNAAWQMVTCRTCRTTYQCTPSSDYFARPGETITGPEDGLCWGCLLSGAGMPEQPEPSAALPRQPEDDLPFDPAAYDDLPTGPIGDWDPGDDDHPFAPDYQHPED